MIQCPNHSCQASNAEANRFCHQCQAPVPRRLLWAVGYQAGTFTPGEVLSGRYLCKASRIFLDQQPGIPPGTLADIPKAVLPYLHLISHQVHLPQVYGWVDAELDSGEMTRLMLLENAALLSIATSSAQAYPVDPTRATQPDVSPNNLPCLLPSLQRAWPYASAAQQLYWLWQLARLWPPLASEQVAATLLKEQLVRVEGPLIRILELRFGLNTALEPLPRDGGVPSAIAAPTLVQLGVFWSSLMMQAVPAIRDFGQSLCQHMIEGHLTDPVILQDVLAEAIHQCGRSQTLQIQMATQTDKGPSRSGNEDACFPPGGSVTEQQDVLNGQEDGGLVIVCDGIGGHQGGGVASDLAIKTIAQQVQNSDHQSAEISTIQADLKLAVAQANDVISQSNDDKQRRDRQRMGTTVVMGLLHGQNCYITHVGDSRAYWVTQWGCHQITLDDDVVSRETRLGYGTYRNILYQPNSGALVQALGMGPSKNLHPTVQRLMLEGEGLLLLCSDGLSDQDLIEACWEAVLRPVLLRENTNLGEVSQQLVDLANTHNGHDNVTVGIMHWATRQTAPIQLGAVIDLSEFITEDTDGDRSSSGRRPVTALSALPNSQGMRGGVLSSLSSLDHPSPVAQETVAQDAILANQSSSSSHVQGSQSDLLTPSDESSTPVIGLQGLSAEDSAPSFDGNAPEGEMPAASWSRLFVAMGVIASLGMISLLVYFWVPAVSDRVDDILGIESPGRPRDDEQNELDESDVQDLTSDSPTSTATESSPFGVDSVIQLKSLPFGSPSATDVPQSTQLAQRPLVLMRLESGQDVASLSSTSVPQAQVVGTIPGGSVLIVRRSFQVPTPDPSEAVPTTNAEGDRSVDDQSIDDQSDASSDRRNAANEQVVLMPGRWVEVQLCATPIRDDRLPQSPNLTDGAIGWVPEAELKSLIQRQFSPASDPNELCGLSPNSSQQ